MRESIPLIRALSARVVTWGGISVKVVREKRLHLAKVSRIIKPQNSKSGVVVLKKKQNETGRLVIGMVNNIMFYVYVIY